MKSVKKGIVFFTALMFVISCFPNFTALADDGETEIIMREFKCSFEENTSGDEIAETDLFDYFVIEGAADGTNLVNSDLNGEMKSYTQIYINEETAEEYFARAYTFQVDFNSTKTPASAIFIRSIDPTLYSVTNPKNSGVQQVFNFFEWDWYAENGGTNCSSGTGGSGIKVYLTSNKICVSIKTRMEDGLYIGTSAAEFDLPENFNADGLNTFKFDDDGKGKVGIAVNGMALCTVEYGGEPGTYPDGDEGDCDALYYKNAVIKGADGTERLKIDNARISADYSVIALGNRGAEKLYFNNLQLTYEEAVPVATPTPEPTPTSEATHTADSTAGATQKPASTNDTKGDTSSDSSMTVIIIGACAAAAAIVVIIVVIIKKRK